MKKLLLILTVLWFASTAYSQAYPLLYTTKLNIKNGNALSIKAPPLSADYTLTFPVDDGTPNQLLKTDGTGGLSWVTISVSGSNTGDVTLAGENYLTIASQIITANPIDLTGTHVTGQLKAASFPILTGDVTTAGGTLATTVARINGNTVPANATGYLFNNGSGTLSWSSPSSFADNVFEITDNTTPSKKAKFEASGITAATTRTYTFPDADGTLTLGSGGTTDVVTKWSNATTITNSSITDNGTTVSTTGNLSTAGNLSLTGSNKTLSLKGDGTGVSTFAAGTQGTTSFNYTLPTTIPTANQVLTATSVSAPNVTLGWSTVSAGSSSFVDNVFEITDNTTPTKKATFQASGITAATTRTYTFPDADGTLTLGSAGTTNTIPKWSSATTIGNSSVTDDGTDVSTNENLKLSGSNKTLTFTGNSTGVSTFAAGTQGTTTVNYTLPTTQPSAGQVLTASAVSGSGPYSATLSWGGTLLVEVEDDSVTNSGTLADPDNLTVSLGASENYLVDAFLYYNTLNNGADVKMAFTYSGTVATDGMRLLGYPTGVNFNFTPVTFTSSGTTATLNVDAGDVYIHIVGYFKTSTAGTFKIQFANSAAGAGRVTTLRGGSYMKLTKF